MTGKSTREGGPVYWSQPNQQVVRNGDPVGIISSDPDPMSAEPEAEAEPKRTGKHKATTGKDEE